MTASDPKLPEHEAIYKKIRNMILFGEVLPGQGVTILGLKAAHITDTAKLANVHHERTVLQAVVDAQVPMDAPLRGHGGLTEQEVPFIANRVLDLPAAPTLRNFDVLHYACTAAAQ